MTHLAQTDQEAPAGQTRVDGGRPPGSPHPPVFLHCGWRTRGTWIWNRFRGLDGVAGFYEPLAEPLAQLRGGTLDGLNAGAWASGHRGLDRPYFDEFRPLLRSDRPGVSGYRTRFATDDFFTPPDAAQKDATPRDAAQKDAASKDAAFAELEQYLRGLLRLAQSRGEQPVLKFSRSTGRIGWMRRTFPDAVHIVVMRDPVSQFASALRQFVSHDNAYFLAMPLMLLGMHRTSPGIADAMARLGVMPPPRTSGLAAWEARLRETGPSAWYRGFLAFWIATAASIPDTVDLIIDSDALTGAPAQRRRHEAALAGLTGRMVDFSDAEPSPSPPTAEAMGLRRSELARAHAAAEAFFAGRFGPYWADLPAMSHVARLLTRARAHGLGDDTAWRGAVTGEPAGGEAVGGKATGSESIGSEPARGEPVRGEAVGDEALGGEWIGDAAIEDAAIEDGAGPDAVARLLSATVRAAKAEQELAAMRASHSWKVTAPLRWLSRSLRVA